MSWQIDGHSACRTIWSAAAARFDRIRFYSNIFTLTAPCGSRIVLLAAAVAAAAASLIVVVVVVVDLKQSENFSIVTL